jgi:hypothetical protein
VRQSVDQVEVDRANPGAPQIFCRSRGLLKALDTVDGALHGRIKTLHPKARAIDAAERQRVDHLFRQRARVDFDGDFRRRQHKEAMPDRSDQVGKRLRRHDGRRAAAEMDVLDLEAAIDLAGHELDLTAQRRRVDGDRFVAAGDRGVAAAIPAHRAAERHMEIKRRGRVRRDRLQPLSINLGSDCIRKMRRGGIARISRQAFLAIASRKI